MREWRGDEMGNRYFHTTRVCVMMLRGMCEGRNEQVGERADEGEAIFFAASVRACAGEILAD